MRRLIDIRRRQDEVVETSVVVAIQRLVDERRDDVEFAIVVPYCWSIDATRRASLQ